MWYQKQHGFHSFQTLCCYLRVTPACAVLRGLNDSLTFNIGDFQHSYLLAYQMACPAGHLTPVSTTQQLRGTEVARSRPEVKAQSQPHFPRNGTSDMSWALEPWCRNTSTKPQGWGYHSPELVPGWEEPGAYLILSSLKLQMLPGSWGGRQQDAGPLSPLPQLTHTSNESWLTWVTSYSPTLTEGFGQSLLNLPWPPSPEEPTTAFPSSGLANRFP